ncbi:Di-copper centre-containing protein [Xylariaceae sp. FL0662B]|nr:Di-copper centre-containing protein [Xylariaceae sp. FL0662B]
MRVFGNPLLASVWIVLLSAQESAARDLRPCCGRTAGIPMPRVFKHLQDNYQRNIRASLKADSCTNENIAVRRSWDDLDDTLRLDYIRAVHCLASKPPQTDRSLAPGIVNRLDDFTYIHINQTNIIHQSGYLLPWHRLFIWQLEQALRDECGYKGYLPYWDNARFSEDQTESKVFDGTMTSFGGNGEYIPHDPVTVILPGFVHEVKILAPAGTGGGCITDGPFQNLTISLGPVAKEVIDPDNKYGYEANSRCLSRDFHDPSSAVPLTWANATTIVSSKDISALRRSIEAFWHRNSHTYVGADGADPFSPTNDPVFYLLHAQIDRLWAIWQGQDLARRTYAIDGNRTFFGLALDYAPDVPPSLATIDDTMDMGLGFKPAVKEGMPMTKNGRCYIYE